MGKIYEIKDKDFEFHINGKPTGHYARGLAIDGMAHELRLELLCNGDKLWFSKSKLVLICSNHTDLGCDNYKERCNRQWTITKPDRGPKLNRPHTLTLNYTKL